MSKRERSFEFARKIEKVADGERAIALDEKGNEVKAYENGKLPVYSTKLAAGADFFCAEEVVIPSIWSGVAQVLASTVKGFIENWVSDSGAKDGNNKKLQPTLVHTGIKANMLEDEVLLLYNRSSNPKKLGLVLANSVGVVDADYFESPETDGEIMFAFYNFMPFNVTIKAGDKIGQGIFQKFLRPTKNCIILEDKRMGGFGSTDKKFSK